MADSDDRRGAEAARRARRQAAIDARPQLSPRAPAPDRFRIATWNLNSLRARTPAVDRFLARARPDVLCLQETKTAAISAETQAMFDARGYQIVHVGSGA